MASNLYTKHLYLNPDIDYLISYEINEYDIKSAGFNIIKKFKLLDSDYIERIERADKKTRQIMIGLQIKKNKEFGELLNAKFVETRKLFFEANDIDDDDIISIKKDAIFTTKLCRYTEFDNIEFVRKNIYTSFYKVNNYELYHNKNKTDVKGISDELLELHRDYMLDFLSTFFNYSEIGNHKKTLEYLLEFSNHYKYKRLHVGYYRELNRQSLYRLNEIIDGGDTGIMQCDDINILNIGYNYASYILYLINMML